MMKQNVTILIPTYNRPAALAVLLTSICTQTFTNFQIIISDQSDKDILDNQYLVSIIRLLQLHGHKINLIKHLPKRGIAEQRQFLLDQAKSKYVLFLDDDLLLEQWVIQNLYKMIREEKIGFVGQAPIGLSYKNDVREDEQHIELWKGKVRPESIKPESKEWQRYKLHSAANILHIQEKFNIRPHHPVTYKIAWVGGCLLYDTQKIRDVGGFNFWRKLPINHCGEDVLVQQKVMQKYGGCAILPSGVYHQELSTTILDRSINAPKFL